MKLIAPITINDARFVSSTVPETDAPAWNAATNYSVGTRVLRTGVHKVFERLLAGTTATAPESDPVNWLDLGATNRWAMFDQVVGSLTTATTSLTAVIAPGPINAVALIGMNAAQATVTLTDPTDGVVFNQTVQPDDLSWVDSWYAYFFNDLVRRESVVLFDLPTYASATLSVTISASAGSQVSLGTLVVGRASVFAEAVRLGAGAGIQDYSRKEADEFGRVQIVERAFAKRARWSFMIENRLIDALQKALSTVRAKPAVYVGGLYDATLIYGFYRDFDTVISYSSHSECSIELEGLI